MSKTTNKFSPDVRWLAGRMVLDYEAEHARPRQPQFQAPRPNALWVSDFTYVATWVGLVYVAFLIDAYARRIIGWRVSRMVRAGFVLDALEQALHERRRAIDNVVFQIRTEIADAARKLADERAAGGPRSMTATTSRCSTLVL